MGAYPEGQENRGQSPPNDQDDLLADLVEARILSEKEFFSVLDRGIVRKNSDGSYDLKYYPSDDDDHIEYIPLNSVKTTTSENDDKLKYKLIRFSVYIIGLAVVGIIIICAVYINLGLLKSIIRENNNGLIIELFFMGASALLYAALSIMAMHTYFMSIKTRLDVNFTQMTTQWATSIAALLGHDIHGRIFGIRRCVLEFRRFIKWRRFGSIYNAMFNWIFYPIAFLYFIIVCSILAATFYISERAFPLENIEAQSIALVLIAAGFFFYPLWHVGRIKRYLTTLISERTKYRDPTVQLAVMVSEMHQRFVQRKMA
ncbi:MAG: hypothetical protein ACK4NO_00240 [Glycocaulis sp.]